MVQCVDSVIHLQHDNPVHTFWSQTYKK